MKVVVLIIWLVLSINVNHEKQTTPIQNKIEVDGETNKQNIIESVEEFLKILELDSDTLYVPFK